MNAVYGAMPPQPRLRFLLADEPGTGKTIMAGLYLREMQRLGFVRSALIVVPAHLVTKWQADLERFFGGGLRAITAQTVREHGLDSGHDLWVVSLDLLSVNGAVQDAVPPHRMGWDAVVFDEAHRLTPTAAGYYQAGRTRETCTWSRGAVDVGPRRLVPAERSGRPLGGARRLLAAGRGPVGAAYPYVQHRRLAAPTMWSSLSVVSCWLVLRVVGPDGPAWARARGHRLDDPQRLRSRRSPVSRRRTGDIRACGYRRAGATCRPHPRPSPRARAGRTVPTLHRALQRRRSPRR